MNILKIKAARKNDSILEQINRTEFDLKNSLNRFCGKVHLIEEKNLQ